MIEKILTIIFAISISSVGIAAPRMSLDVQNVDFGEVAANAALVREVRVGNAGDAPLRVSVIRQDPRAPK